MKKVLFIDRDGTLIWEPPDTLQIDSFKKLKFLPGVFTYLGRIARELDYELVMVTNQDGLGTDSFPENTFWPIQNFIIQVFEKEGIIFSEVCIDKSLESENKPTRKPNTGMLGKYLEGNYDLQNSYVIGDRLTDVKLAENLKCKSILLKNNDVPEGNIEAVVETWENIYRFLKLPPRKTTQKRKTNETDIT
ncbi:MAG TPA: histidinol-phosphatase, partial [Bacteroidia bacterium]|nr:histidinol-phosphatase [Bacteroidia bacterium]